MPCSARLRFQRMLAALLWLIASFAFLIRQQDMVPMTTMPGMVVMGTMSSAVETVQTAPPAERAEPMQLPMNASGAGPAGQTGKRAAPPHVQPSHGQHDANAPPAPAPHSDTHAGHCPFCFTAAFALAVFSVELLAQPAPQRVAQDRARPAAPRLLAGHQRARAPPFWS
ncbi:hypothetical protein [Deinococcus alpinitundrae]|uniref:hypothetical protein n=1 Tax=Deinococcus alpinitundrae TaxID=468913 RepID=UPI00137A9541|nr:hypothetical protein [Deinococcus alpinitundrae]